MRELVTDPLLESLQITVLVFLMLILMDLAYVYSRGRVHPFLQAKPGLQYIIAAFLGAIPGCEGAFLAVSLYAHGLIGIGALFSAFIATTGDEAIVMLSLFPLKALALFGGLVVAGFIFGWLLDRTLKFLGWQHLIHCETIMFHPHVKFSFRHYFGEHLWNHLLKKHILRIFIWTFMVLTLTKILTQHYNLNEIISSRPLLSLWIAGFIGLFPQSGPHLIFVNMFARGNIIFSIFFTNMFVQNGHALLPLLSISWRDSIFLKILALILGIVLGTLLFSLGF